MTLGRLQEPCSRTSGPAELDQVTVGRRSPARLTVQGQHAESHEVIAHGVGSIANGEPQGTSSVGSLRGDLSELTPAPAFAKVWTSDVAFEGLLDLLGQAKCAFVRAWVIAYLEREHAQRLGKLTLSRLLPLLRAACSARGRARRGSLSGRSAAARGHGTERSAPAWRHRTVKITRTFARTSRASSPTSRWSIAPRVSRCSRRCDACRRLDVG